MTNIRQFIIQDKDDPTIQAAVDEPGSALVGINLEHHRIHQGIHFFFTDAQTIGNGNNVDYMLTTPNTAARIHLIYEVDFTAVTQIELYENGDRNGTVGQTERNNDRNSGTSAVLVIHIGTGGGSTDGTQIRNFEGGLAAGAQARGGNPVRSNEIILKQNTKYILRISSSTAANLCNVIFNWYEASVPEP